MTLTKKAGLMGAIGCALIAGQAVAADDVFINPEWANSAWYVGGNIGRSRANIDDVRLIRSLTANGAGLNSFTADEKDVGYKLYVGKQLNQYFAVEAGFFDLGKFSFKSTTTQNGTLNGEAGFRGANLDLVAQVPLSQRFSVFGRAGMNYAKATTRFNGNRLFAVTNPSPSERKLNAKAGFGLEYKFSEALALRGEVERYRVNDAVGNRGDVDLFSVGLVYKIGRPAAKAAPAPVEPAPMPVVPTVAPEAAQPAAEPVKPMNPVSEKSTFSAEAVFAFDSAVLRPAGKASLDGLLAKLQGMDADVMITVGHTDSIGRAAYNQKLSLRRAASVKAYLVSKGVDAARVYTEGKGETQPVADNKTAQGRAKNRRVTVEVVGTRSGAK
ncbi:OmpA family protein [Massilia sp. P8910]|uniref:OmpA family protein n=1 Tax=Massilia antarctica TaxID=2765360 RepID=UPI001E59B08C|nr:MULTISPECIES: OmpA family protein [Massilia]MCE3605020.1 OmpA family protein [Massilia antarctica]MCY0911578.1 OmpA family protein [Massilia sp. H27-R4]